MDPVLTAAIKNLDSLVSAVESAQPGATGGLKAFLDDLKAKVEADLSTIDWKTLFQAAEPVILQGLQAGAAVATDPKVKFVLMLLEQAVQVLGKSIPAPAAH